MSLPTGLLHPSVQKKGKGGAGQLSGFVSLLSKKRGGGRELRAWAGALTFSGFQGEKGGERKSPSPS